MNNLIWISQVEPATTKPHQNQKNGTKRNQYMGGKKWRDFAVEKENINPGLLYLYSENQYSVKKLYTQNINRKSFFSLQVDGGNRQEFHLEHFYV